MSPWQTCDAVVILFRRQRRGSVCQRVTRRADSVTRRYLPQRIARVPTRNSTFRTRRRRAHNATSSRRQPTRTDAMNWRLPRSAVDNRIARWQISIMRARQHHCRQRVISGDKRSTCRTHRRMILRRTSVHYRAIRPPAGRHRRVRLAWYQRHRRSTWRRRSHTRVCPQRRHQRALHREIVLHDVIMRRLHSGPRSARGWRCTRRQERIDV